MFLSRSILYCVVLSFFFCGFGVMVYCLLSEQSRKGESAVGSIAIGGLLSSRKARRTRFREPL